MLSASGGRSLNMPSELSNKFRSVRDLYENEKGSSEGMIEEEIKEDIQIPIENTATFDQNMVFEVPPEFINNNNSQAGK